VILFLTDGKITLGMGKPNPDGNKDIKPVSDLYALIKTLDKEAKATIFTFSLGKDLEKTVPWTIACAHKGIWTQLSDTANRNEIKTQMSSYY